MESKFTMWNVPISILGFWNNLGWRVIIKVFGFWNVYYFPKNIPCFFLGHKWQTEETFQIQCGKEKLGESFALLKCVCCKRYKWRNA